VVGGRPGNLPAPGLRLSQSELPTVAWPVGAPFPAGPAALGTPHRDCCTYLHFSVAAGRCGTDKPNDHGGESSETGSIAEFRLCA
jgi:hypothetical protein